MAGLAVLTGLMAAVVGYVQITVPIAGSGLAAGDTVHYWQVAVIGGVVVLVAAIGVSWLSLRAWGRRP